MLKLIQKLFNTLSINWENLIINNIDVQFYKLVIILSIHYIYSYEKTTLLMIYILSFIIYYIFRLLIFSCWTLCIYNLIIIQ